MKCVVRNGNYYFKIPIERSTANLFRDVFFHNIRRHPDIPTENLDIEIPNRL